MIYHVVLREVRATALDLLQSPTWTLIIDGAHKKINLTLALTSGLPATPFLSQTASLSKGHGSSVGLMAKRQ